MVKSKRQKVVSILQKLFAKADKAGFAGPCTRCEMVCMDQKTGLKVGPEPLLTLASFRRIKGRILFGILLTHQPPAQPQPQHMRALRQGSGYTESHDPAQVCQHLYSPPSKAGSQASSSHPPVMQAAKRSLEDHPFPVLRVGMPVLPST